MDVRKFLQNIRHDPEYDDQITAEITVPARQGNFSEPVPPLAAPLPEVLKLRGISQLYTHQTQSVDAIRQEQDIVVVTGTASGKTLCYHLPVIEASLHDENFSVLFLFPTKALGADQLRHFVHLYEDCHQQTAPAYTYDGDTPQHHRQKIRREARFLFTNPDMLHAGILPNHIKWSSFLHKLRFVILDEIHVYRGVFGSNTAWVMRRLQRLADYYESSYRIICCSATIGNPEELARYITGRNPILIDTDSAPRPQKFFVFWNASRETHRTSQSKSPNIQAKQLMATLLEQNAQTIAFTRTRAVAELLYKYLYDYFKTHHSTLAEKIHAYRSGYLPAVRRQLEADLSSGKLRGITTTNALELGIDIGGLDASIINSYPGSIASFLQQAGRAGRRKEGGLTIFIAHNNPQDQFLIFHPEYLLGQKPESAVIDIRNPYILTNHISSAAFELPLRSTDQNYFGNSFLELVHILEDTGYLKQIHDKWFWSRTEKPAALSSLRSITEETYTIFDSTVSQTILGTIDGESAFFITHPGAIYLHAGESYEVTHLDTDAKRVTVRQGQFDFYTQPIATSHIQILNTHETQAWRNIRVSFGELQARVQVHSFAKIRHYSLERLSVEKLELPERNLKTAGMWIDVSQLDFSVHQSPEFNPVTGLAGLKNILLLLLPLQVMCDKNDIAGAVDMSNFGYPVLIAFDKYSGGIGFIEKGFSRFPDLIHMCHDIVSQCPCSHGCPSCIGADDLGMSMYRDRDENGRWIFPHKDSTKKLLEMIRKNL